MLTLGCRSSGGCQSFPLSSGGGPRDDTCLLFLSQGLESSGVSKLCLLPNFSASSLSWDWSSSQFSRERFRA